jgi:hypothetical protein
MNEQAKIQQQAAIIKQAKEVIATQEAYISNLKDQVNMYKQLIEIKEETIRLITRLK